VVDSGVELVVGADVTDVDEVVSELELDVVFAAELDEVVEVLDTELLVVVVFPVDFPVLVVDESVAVVLPVPNAPPRALVTPPKIFDNGSATCFFSWRAKTELYVSSSQVAWVRAMQSARMERSRS
jgi:hypothetical protein